MPTVPNWPKPDGTRCHKCGTELFDKHLREESKYDRSEVRDFICPRCEALTVYHRSSAHE